MGAGSRLKSSDPKPSHPKKKPLMASVSATGMPSASRTKNEAMQDSARISFSGMFSRLAGLHFGRKHAAEEWHQGAQRGGKALHEQKQESDRYHRFQQEPVSQPAGEIGRAHVCTPVTNAHLVCRLLLERKNDHQT